MKKNEQLSTNLLNTISHITPAQTQTIEQTSLANLHTIVAGSSID